MLRLALVVCVAVAMSAVLSHLARADDGDAAAGEQVFKKCQVCHTIEEGAPGKTGPNLFGVVGRRAGTAEGFERYSPALMESGVVWDEAALSQWLRGPAKFIPGVRMPFKLAEDGDIANIIAYLMANLPEPPE